MGGNASELTENGWQGVNVKGSDLRDNRGSRWSFQNPATAGLNFNTSVPVLSNSYGTGFRVVDLGPSARLIGDFNDDELIGAADIDILSMQVASGVYSRIYDVTGEGSVNFESGAAAAVPEPSALALFGLALCGLGALRRSHIR